MLWAVLRLSVRDARSQLGIACGRPPAEARGAGGSCGAGGFSLAAAFRRIRARAEKAIHARAEKAIHARAEKAIHARAEKAIHARAEKANGPGKYPGPFG
jgi:hypothetical protein